MQLRPCGTVEETCDLRAFIEMHRLEGSSNEVKMMRNKHKLFLEYCKLKKVFVTSSNCDLETLKIQVEFLDGIWAKWIQNCGTNDLDLKPDTLQNELRQIVKDCSERAKRFESENIYQLLKFGAVRLLKGDFERATEFFDRVVSMDPAWSAFAHYNRAYCTIQLKGDGYIRRAVDDLEAASCKLNKYAKKIFFSEIFVSETKVKHNSDVVDAAKITPCSVLMECQLLHHIHTQIIECIEKLKTIDTVNGTVTTVRQNILDLIPGADCKTKRVLHEYLQLGLLFIYNIDDKPIFCYRHQIVTSLVILKSVAYTILIAVMKGILVSIDSREVRDMIDEACNIGSIDDDSLGWMSRCVAGVINAGIQHMSSIRNISSLVSHGKNYIESKSEMTAETLEFARFAGSQATSVFKLLERKMQELKSFVKSQDSDVSLHVTNAMNLLKKTIEQTVQEKINPGQELHREICIFYGNVKSKSRSNLQQFSDCIRELAQLSTHSFHQTDADIQTGEIKKIAFDLKSKSGEGNFLATDLLSNTPMIATTAEIIDIGIFIENVSVWLGDKITQFQKKRTDEYLCNDTEMLEAIYCVLTSVWSDHIQFMVQNRIWLDLRRYTMLAYSLTTQTLQEKFYLTTLIRDFDEDRQVEYRNLESARIRASQKLSCRLKEIYRDWIESYEPQMWLMTEARLESKYAETNFIILDAEQEVIFEISFPENLVTCKLIYNPPTPEFPEGHYYDLETRRVVTHPDDIYMPSWESFFSAQIDEQPRQWGELFASEEFACLLKRGRALLRSDSHQSTIRFSRRKHMEPESLHISSCIEQTSRSGNSSQLAKFLAKFETGSRSVGTFMTSPVSHDAREIFIFSGSSVEAEVYRQLVEERINDDHITTALKLCCIGYQLPFCRDAVNINLQISDSQTLEDIFEKMFELKSCKPVRSKFLSICDEWYEVLEPRGLMYIEQRKLLGEWISTRQYANTEDPVVSLVIAKCATPKRQGRRERRREEERRLREDKFEKDSEEIRKMDEFQRRKNMFWKVELIELAYGLTQYDMKEYEFESRLFEAETETMTSPDSSKLFEELFFRHHIVERIVDDDITTAFKLFCIEHRVPFCRGIINGNRPISDDPTIKKVFDELLNIESDEQVKSKFLAICDAWYKALEPKNLMNYIQKELLRKWITDRQYADYSAVLQVITKYLKQKKDEEDRTRKEVTYLEDEEQLLQDELREEETEEMEQLNRQDSD